MYIYDKKDDSIVLYTIEAKKEELKRYKRKIIEANDADLLYYLITTVVTTKDRFVNSEELAISDIVYGPEWTIPGRIQSNLRKCGGTKNIAYLKELCLRFHAIGWPPDREDECEEQINLIEQYINGDFDNIPLIRIIEENNHDFYLLRTEAAKTIMYGSFWVIDNIIKLPRSLQILQLLLQGKYEKINEAEITDQLKLFNINYYDSVKLNNIRDMHITESANDSYESILEKVSSGSRILQKYKK